MFFLTYKLKLKQPHFSFNIVESNEMHWGEAEGVVLHHWKVLDLCFQVLDAISSLSYLFFIFFVSYTHQYE
jgi:hypothetical protein